MSMERSLLERAQELEVRMSMERSLLVMALTYLDRACAVLEGAEEATGFMTVGQGYANLISARHNVRDALRLVQRKDELTESALALIDGWEK